ncbi:MAG: DoxX family protein [Acetobacteraceae bacterium]
MKTVALDGLALLGRVLMSAIFVKYGFEKAMAPTATMAYLAKQNLPLVGGAYVLTILVELGGGILFLLGYRARIVALVLAAWCVATALIGHHPSDPAQMTHFMKNLCMAGGFLQIAAYGAGRFALTRN